MREGKTQDYTLQEVITISPVTREERFAVIIQRWEQTDALGHQCPDHFLLAVCCVVCWMTKVLNDEQVEQ